ncbi:MAG: polyamine ABC transporter substrate-binding protein [Chromatiales bacterium]|jgi:putrescine transport system substrate-binding protein
MRHLIAITWLVAGCAGLGGCGDTSTTAGPVVRVYNWSDYIAEETVADFERETGIDVVYDVFDSNEVLEAKLLSGASGYDIVVPTSDFLGRQILAGVFQPLDRDKLRNYVNLDPGLMELMASYDPENRYAVPYLWGTTGIGYNVDMVAERLGDLPIDSIGIFFDPQYLARLADCGVAVLDAPSELFPAVLNYLGYDPNIQDPELYKTVARDALLAIRPYILYFHSSQYINDLANGDICFVFGWSGDVLQAKARAQEAQNGVRIEYVIPREGALLWVDTLAIPVGALNVDNAHRFIDYLMRPEVIAEISNYVQYANGNAASLRLLDPAVRDDPGIYPPPEVRAKLFPNKVTPPRLDRVATRVWTQVKTGR